MSCTQLERQKTPPFVTSIRWLIEGIVSLNGVLPYAKAREHACQIIRDIPYTDTGCTEHRLDVIRRHDATGVQPALVYIHGGGFAVCSKQTHEILTYQYARMGFTVFSIDYRLMPEYRFPCGFRDCCDALLWVQEHAGEYGADADRLVIAGESAGGNFTLGLAAAACYRDANEPWAARIYDAAPNIQAIIPACGALQVSGMQRLWQRSSSDPITRKILMAMQRDYLPAVDTLERPAIWADPLLIVERRQFSRTFPPTFVFCGTADVLLDDTLRLGRRLEALDVPVVCETYPGEIHAFQALVWRENAKKVWRSQRRFLAHHVDGLSDRS